MTTKIALRENLKQGVSSSQVGKRGRPKKQPQKVCQIQNQTPKTLDQIDSSKIVSEENQTLKQYVKELTEENSKLKEKNAELEALLSAAKDEIEEYEEAISELANKYENLLSIQPQIPSQNTN